MSYEKPRAKPGLICWYVSHNPDGTIREARYRKPERAAPDEPAAAPRRRGVIAAERPARKPAQGALFT